MRKIAIIDSAQWTSWPDKTSALRQFWLQADEELEFHVFPYTGSIPFDPANDILPGSFQPRQIWYKAVAENLAPNFDEYLLIVPPEKWGNQAAQAWIFDGKYMSLSCGEFNKLYFSDNAISASVMGERSPYEGGISTFFWFACHEISHNICQDRGIEDKTHYYFDLKNPAHLGVLDYLESAKPSPLRAVIIQLKLILKYLGWPMKQQIESIIKTLETLPPEPIIKAVAFTAKATIEKLAQAMARIETSNFNAGTLPMRLNNPLALKFAGQPYAKPIASGFAEFDTIEHGWDAGHRQLRAICRGQSPAYNAQAAKLGLKDSGELTLKQMLYIWASSSSETEKYNYYRRVYAELGVDSVKMKEIV